MFSSNQVQKFFPIKVSNLKSCSLGQFVTRSMLPLGMLTNAGRDIGAMISEERSSKILKLAEQRAWHFGDQYWALQIGERLFDLDASLQDSVNYIQALIDANQVELASKKLQKLDLSKVNRVVYQQLETALIVAAKEYEELVPHASMLLEQNALTPVNTMLDVVQALIDIGEIEVAEKFLEELEIKHGFSIHIASKKVKLFSYKEGPIEARVLLENMASDFCGDTSLIYQNLYSQLLIANGQHREAFHILRKLVSNNRDQWGLYPDLKTAAIHSHNSKYFAEYARVAYALYPDDLSARVLKFQHHIHREDFSQLDDDLKSIREYSEYQYSISKLEATTFLAQDRLVKEAYSYCRDLNMVNLMPDLIACDYYYYFSDNKKQLKQLATRIADQFRTNRTRETLARQHFRLLIKQDKLDQLKNEWQQLPEGFKKFDYVSNFGLYLDAHGDKKAKANIKTKWAKKLYSTAHGSVTSTSELPKVEHLRYRAGKNDILLFCSVFNAAEYIPWFLNYYRELGVTHFFFIDNRSTDKTYELLVDQKDVSLFSHDGSFGEAYFGGYWVNHLMQKYGCGKWCLYVDMDEAFVYPGSDDGKKLPDLIRFLEKEKSESVRAFMLDIFPKKNPCKS